MIKIMAFTISLHHVCKFWIVDVTDLCHLIHCEDVTASRVSGETPSISNHRTYSLPSVLSGSRRNFSTSRVVEVIRGLSWRIRLPVESESIVSRSLLMKNGVAVASPSAATMSC